MSEIFENLMYWQLCDYFDAILSPKQRGFCKSDSAQPCLMVKLDKFNETKNRDDALGALFSDSFNEFDCTDHNLPITKLS